MDGGGGVIVSSASIPHAIDRITFYEAVFYAIVQSGKLYVHSDERAFLNYLIR